MRVEDEYLDVLQNLEVAIVREFRKDPRTLDLDVREAASQFTVLSGGSRGRP